ncbi:MAG: hypothetical protein MUO42_04750 [Anaerolineaceae bacterium]|nr:hypothetical protein [Anaerolineaceae bacterium]
MITFLKFVLKRLLAIPVTLFIITVIIYGIVILMPLESRINLYMPKSNSNFPGWQERMHEKIIERNHMDDTFPVQYYYWVRSLFEGECGYSPTLDKDVLPELIKRTLVIFKLIFYSLLFQIPLGLLAGVWSARKKDHPEDYAARLILAKVEID